MITHDPFSIKYAETELYADLAAEKPFVAERGEQKIIVEVKSFIGRSPMNDFHGALGQYTVYRHLVEMTEPEYKVYLAIDDIVHENFFQRLAIQAIIKAQKVALIIVDIAEEEIIQWIN